MGRDSLIRRSGVEIDEGIAWSVVSVPAHMFEQLEGVAAWLDVEYREVLESMLHAAFDEMVAKRWCVEAFNKLDCSYFVKCKAPGDLPGYEDGQEIDVEYERQLDEEWAREDAEKRGGP